MIARIVLKSHSKLTRFRLRCSIDRLVGYDRPVLNLIMQNISENPSASVLEMSTSYIALIQISSSRILSTILHDIA